MPEVWTRIVEAIASGPTAWSTPDEVITAVQGDEDEILDELAAMDVGGLLDVWERPEGLVVTLSALAAERGGYRLVEMGRALNFRWTRKDDPESYPGKGSQVPRLAPAEQLGFVVDPRPIPEDEAEQSESAARYQANGLFGTFRRGAGRGEPPRPTLLIGLNLNGWPGPQSLQSRSCPACGTRILPAHAYCLYCDRWGLDARDGVEPLVRGAVRNPRWDGEHSTRPQRMVRQDEGGCSHDPRQVRKRSWIERDRRARLIERDRRRGIGPIE